MDPYGEAATHLDPRDNPEGLNCNRHLLTEVVIFFYLKGTTMDPLIKNLLPHLEKTTTLNAAIRHYIEEEFEQSLTLEPWDGEGGVLDRLYRFTEQEVLVPVGAGEGLRPEDSLFVLHCRSFPGDHTRETYEKELREEFAKLRGKKERKLQPLWSCPRGGEAFHVLDFKRRTVRIGSFSVETGLVRCEGGYCAALDAEWLYWYD